MNVLQLPILSVTVSPGRHGSPVEPEKSRAARAGLLHALKCSSGSAGLSYAGATFIALAGAERVQFFAELEGLATSWAAFKSSRCGRRVHRADPGDDLP